MFKIGYRIAEDPNGLYYLYVTCNDCCEYYLEGTVADFEDDPVFSKWLDKYREGTLEPLCKDCTIDRYFDGDLLEYLSKN